MFHLDSCGHPPRWRQMRMGMTKHRHVYSQVLRAVPACWQAGSIHILFPVKSFTSPRGLRCWTTFRWMNSAYYGESVLPFRAADRRFQFDDIRFSNWLSLLIVSPLLTTFSCDLCDDPFPGSVLVSLHFCIRWAHPVLPGNFDFSWFQLTTSQNAAPKPFNLPCSARPLFPETLFRAVRSSIFSISTWYSRDAHRHTAPQSHQILWWNLLPP